MKKILAICIAIFLLILATVVKAQHPYYSPLGTAAANYYSTFLPNLPFYPPQKPAIFATTPPVAVGANPVTIQSFAAKKNNKGTQLTWSVGAENYVAHYEIQKGKDEKTFATIATIAATGQSSYSYTDSPTAKGVIFYRIKSVDTDGEYKYSTVISMVKGEPFRMLVAYPMPAQMELTLQHQLATDKSIISIHTEDGSLLQRITPVAGTLQTGIDLSYIKSGFYVLRFDNGEGQAEILKIVKQ